MYFDGGEMVIGASIDLVNRRKEARGHFWAAPGIKVINKRIKSRVANIRWLAGWGAFSQPFEMTRRFGGLC